MRPQNLLFLSLLTPFSISAQQTGGQVTWSSKAFNHTVFVENKGQFNDKADRKSDVLYGFVSEGMQIYLTTNGVIYQHEETILHKENEEKERKRGEKKEEERPEYIQHIVKMNWDGANPSVRVIAEEPVTNFFSYSDPSDKTHLGTLKCTGYKKVTYQNIYPGIDIVYTFPGEGKSGIKYAAIVHPGADPSLIKMNYSGNKSIKLDANGNILIESSLGLITDHSPATFLANGETVNSSFKLKSGIVSFSLAPSPHQQSKIKNQKLTIDPWSSVPVFTGTNSCYDVEYDLAGNVYVYGGTSPYQLLKFNTAGVQQWTYTTNLYSNSPWKTYYGDFCVTGASGNSFIIEGIYSSNGGRIIKVGTNGAQVGLWAGSVNFEEMWRIVYNNCTKQMIIAGGGVSKTNQGCTIDTMLTNMNAVNSLNTNEIAHDMCFLALDNSSNCYMATTNWGNVNLNNRMIRVPAATLQPSSFLVADGYTFQEGGNLTYIAGGQANGYNGICVSPNFLYTFDGGALKKWDKLNGTLLLTINPSGTLRTWGGMAVDDCDNLYVGFQNTVRQYDATLTLINTINVANTVYDVRLGPNNKLYAAGKAFVAEIQLNTNCGSTMNVSANANGGNCTSQGNATATATGGTGSYSYSWSNGQTTQTATGLGAGIYTVTIKDNSCFPQTKTATVNVSITGGFTLANTLSNNLCFGGNTGQATASVTGGTSPYTYTWNNGQTTTTATGLSAGTYTATVTDANGCTNSITVSITQPPAIAIQTSGTNATCAQGGSINTTVSGGTGAYTYAWNNGQTGATATNIQQGTYTVTVTDGNGCTKTATHAITGTAGPTAGIGPTSNVLCNGGTTGSATATATGGTGTLTYVWNNGQSTATTTGLSAGTYTVVVNDGNGCTSTSSVTITEPPVLTANALGTISCSGQTATASATGAGGTPSYSYSWSNGQLTQTATGLTNGVYTVTITDANNCTVSTTAQVNSNATPNCAFTADDTTGCQPLCVTFTCTTSNIVSYSWDFGDGNTGNGVSPKHCYNSPGTYSVTITITDINGCSCTLTKPNYINVFPQVNANFSATPQPTTILNPVITFTDLSTGGANTWSWTFGDLLNSTSSVQNPTFNYKDSGCYNVELIANNQYNCPDTADKVVCINGDYELFAPNAFTPNGSGLNDVWNVKGIGIDPNHFKLWIFDRWGNLIFETSDLYKGWNGHANGGKEIAQQDVYVWKVATQDFLGGKHNYIGHVSLLR